MLYLLEKRKEHRFIQVRMLIEVPPKQTGCVILVFYWLVNQVKCVITCPAVFNFPKIVLTSPGTRRVWVLQVRISIDVPPKHPGCVILVFDC